MRDIRGFAWPTAVVAIMMPLVLLGVGLTVPDVEWGRLPKSRPGALLLPAAFGLIGVVRLARQAWLLREPRRDLHQPEPYEGSFLTISGFNGWLQARFGPIAGGLFLLALGSGLSVAFTVTSVGSESWQAVPWVVTTPAIVGMLGAILGAFFLGWISGMVLRRVDQGAVFVGGRRRLKKELAKLVEENQSE